MSTLSVKDLQERYGVGEHTILGWVKQGSMIGIDVSRKQGGRPKWRFTETAVAAFEALRASTPEQPSTERRRKKSNNAIEFYK